MTICSKHLIIFIGVIFFACQDSGQFSGNNNAKEKSSSSSKTEIVMETDHQEKKIDDPVSEGPATIKNKGPYKSCKEILENGASHGDGTYTIDPDGDETEYNPLEIYCDMTVDDGGWMLISDYLIADQKMLTNLWETLASYIKKTHFSTNYRIEVHTSQRVYKQFNLPVKEQGPSTSDNSKMVIFGKCKQGWKDEYSGLDYAFDEKGQMNICVAHACSHNNPINTWQSNVLDSCHLKMTAEDGCYYEAMNNTYYAGTNPFWNAYCGGLIKSPIIIASSGCGMNHKFNHAGPEGETQETYRAFITDQKNIKWWSRPN